VNNGTEGWTGTNHGDIFKFYI